MLAMRHLEKVFRVVAELAEAEPGGGPWTQYQADFRQCTQRLWVDLVRRYCPNPAAAALFPQPSGEGFPTPDQPEAAPGRPGS